MKFNIWLLMLLALLQVFVLFTGLSAASGFASSVDWIVIGLLLAAAAAVAYLAKRSVEASSENSSNEAVENSDARTPGDEDTVIRIAGESGYASPPCFMHELDPSYLGYASRDEVLAFLNQLLEAERDGARSVREMREQAASTRLALGEIADDEARLCAMLVRHITRLGGTPSKQRGALYERRAALEGRDEPLDLLNRGQGWVARRLREEMPKIADDLLQGDLKEMLATNQHNIERCAQLGQRHEVSAVA